jgi:hypothetical protein
MSKRNNVRFEKIYFLSLQPLLPTEIAFTLREWVTEMVGGTLLLMAFGVLYVFLTVVV